MATTTAAMGWENPTSTVYSTADGTVTLNVSNENNAENVTFSIEGPQGYNDTEIKRTNKTEKDFITYDLFIGSSDPVGRYQVSATASDGNFVNDQDIYFDGSPPPKPSLVSEERINSESEIRFEIGPDTSGIKNYSAEVVSGDASVSGSSAPSCGPDETCEVVYDIDTDSLENGNPVDIQIEVTDNVGRLTSKEFTLTYDDSYDGAEPTFEVPDADADGDVRLGTKYDEVSLKAYVDEVQDGGEPSDIRVKCYDEDGMFAKTNLKDVDEQNVKFSCEVPTQDYAGSSEDFYVEACDEAGNCQSSDEKTYSFDSDSPFVTSFEPVKAYNVYNKNFDVEFVAGDDASGIERAEYFFDPSTQNGSGVQINRDGDGRFTVDTSSLSKGQHTVFFRVKDGVGRWSEIKSVDFEFYPNKVPKAEVDVPDTYNLTAGAEGTIQATVRNSGKLFITSMNVSITDSAISSGTETVTNLASGDSVPVNFQISTNASDVGRKELTVSTDQPSASAAVTVFVKANQDQRERVKRLLSNYSSRLENLQNNISDLRSSGLPEEMNKTLSSNVSDFRESVKRSEQYVSEGKYFKALSELEGVSEDYATASSTFTQIKNSYQVRQRNRMIITALVVLLIGVVAAGVHFFRKGELSIDLTEDDIPGLVEAQEILREKFEDLKEFVEKEEEEAEKKFEGFK